MVLCCDFTPFDHGLGQRTLTVNVRGLSAVQVTLVAFPQHTSNGLLGNSGSCGDVALRPPSVTQRSGGVVRRPLSTPDSAVALTALPARADSAAAGGAAGPADPSPLSPGDQEGSGSVIPEAGPGTPTMEEWLCSIKEGRG